MKKPVTQFDLAAAFKALDEIDYGTAESNPVKNSKKLNESLLKETCKRISGRKLNIERLVEDYYDLDDEQDLNKAAADREAEIAQAKLSRIEKIVDLDAKTADDLLPSYVGKVIIRCPQCMNMFYKNEEDIVKDEEDPTICNVNEPCQHCGNISGYEIIGKVDKLSPEDTAQLAGDEETPAEGEEDLDLDITEEEAPAEEGEATEEDTEEDVDLDLDLDLEEPAQESLNASKAAKSDFASKNETENKTLNESRAWKNDLEFCQMINDGKVKPNPYGLGYIRLGELSQLCVDNHLDYAHNVIEQAISKLTEKGDKCAEALTEANKYGRSDDEDYYAQDINDAVMQLKKTGHAEFWCRQGKAKAEQVVKTFEDRYGKKAEYTIDDDYCTARVVKEALTESSASQILAAFEASLGDDNFDAPVEESVNKAEIDKTTVPETASENKSINEDGKKCKNGACEPKQKGKLDEAVAITIGVSEVDDKVVANGPADAMIVAEPEAVAVYDQPEFPEIKIEPQDVENPFDQDFETTAEFAGKSEEVDDEVEDEPVDEEEDEETGEEEDEKVDESLQEGIFDTAKNIVKRAGSAVKNTIASTKLDKAFDGFFVTFIQDLKYDKNKSSKIRYVDCANYDEAKQAAIILSKKIASNTAIDDKYGSYVPDDIEDSILNNKWVLIQARYKADGKVTLIDSYRNGEQTDTGKYQLKWALAAASTMKTADVDESLQEGIFDSIKNKASQAKSAVKGKSVEDGFSKWKVVSTANNGKSTVKDFASYAEARNYAIAMSKQMSIKQALIKATDTTGVESAIDGYIKGKQALAAKKLFKKAQLAAQGAPVLDNNLELDTSNPEPVSEPASEVKPEGKPEGKPTKDELTAALTAAGYKDPKTIQKIVNALAANNLVTEALNEDLDSATDKAVAKLQALNDQAMSTIAAAEGTEEPREELLADNANDAAGFETIDDKYQAGGFGDETPNTEDDKTEVEENLQEDVSDAEYDQMLNSKVFQDFNEEFNLDDIDEIDEESVNECTTNYLKEVYSNVDRFELTRADVTNGVLVLEGLIRFHSGKTRNTTFGYNLATGKHLAFSGVNEDLAKNGKFNIQCSLNNKSLVVESLSYSHEVNGQLVEGLVHKN